MSAEPAESDPVLHRRRQMARLASLGQRIGYGSLAVAVVAFVVGMAAGFNDTAATVVIAALVVGSITLAPAIVLGYSVKAADREDRERHGGRPLP